MRLKIAVVTTAVLLGSFVMLHASRAVSDEVTFLPENNMKIEVGTESGGLTQDQYNAVMDQLEAYYGPIVAAKGGKLVLNRMWTNSTVNSSAERQGNNYVINAYGGLARHPAITQDSETLVVCHEMGHHLGGFPKVSGMGVHTMAASANGQPPAGWPPGLPWPPTGGTSGSHGGGSGGGLPGGGLSWASNEGESDYFATLKCMRRIFGGQGSSGFTRNPMTGQDAQIAQTQCAKAFSDPAQQAVCLRMIGAGMDVAALFMDLSKDPTASHLYTPDKSVVSQTDDQHPATQCRLDTYFQGAICQVAFTTDVSDTDPTIGTCTLNQGFTTGIRPLCWYKPTAAEQAAPASPLVSKSLGTSPILSTLKSVGLWSGN